MDKPLVEVYARKDCSLCKYSKGAVCIMCIEAKDMIGRVRKEIPFQFREVDITVSDELFRMYEESIPTIFINGKKAFKFKVDEAEFRKRVRKEIIKAGLSRVSNKKQHYS